MKNTRQLILIGFLDCVIVAIGFSSMWVFISGSKLNWVGYNLPNPGIFMALTSTVLALVTFFGLLAVSESSGRGWGSNKGSMRGTIAATVLVVYFFVFSQNAFQPFKSEMSEMMETMVTSFTAIIGIVIPFYFGASAYVQTHTKDGDNPPPPITKD